VEIAFGGFEGGKLGGEDFAVGVLHAESGEERAAAFQSVVRTAIELYELAFAGGAQAALTMSGGRSVFWASRCLPCAGGGEGFRG
jgi:hypothetical protein